MVNTMFDTYKKIFDNRAESYHKAMRDFPLARKEEFEWALHYLAINPGDNVCDVPSGGGYLKDFALDEDCFFNFLETSESFASYNVDCPNSKTQVCEFEDLPLANQSVDSLICLAALHHVDNREKVFQEFRRVVKSQGKILIVDVEEGSNTAGFLNVFVNEYNSMGHNGSFINGQVVNSLEKNEITVVSYNSHTFQWTFDNEHCMVTFCRGLFGLDKATDEDIIHGIKIYLNPHYQQNQVSLDWDLVYIVCN